MSSDFFPCHRLLLLSAVPYDTSSWRDTTQLLLPCLSFHILRLEWRQKKQIILEISVVPNRSLEVIGVCFLLSISSVLTSWNNVDEIRHC